MRPLLAAAIAFWPVVAAAQTAATVQATVVDALTGAALARARVMSASAQPQPDPLFTGDRGELTLRVPAEGQEFRVTKAGYATALISIGRQTKAPVTIALARGASITGRVRQPSGGPVTGMMVSAVAEGGKSGEAEFTAKTNDLGEYRLGSLPEGRYTVTPMGVRDAVTTAARPRLPAGQTRVAPQHIVVHAGDEVSSVDFVVAFEAGCRMNGVPRRLDPDLGAISGRIVAAAGYPIACATVRLTQEGSPSRAVRTNGAGFYIFFDVVPGEYTVEASHAEFLTTQFGHDRFGQPAKRVVVQARRTSNDINVTLPHRSAITGTVLDDRGEPILGAAVRALQVRVIDGRRAASSLAADVTDDRGMYRLHGLLPGRYVVSALPDGAVSEQGSPAGYPATYYPGTILLDEATAVPVEQERDRPAVDFVRLQTRVATVRGYAYDIHGHPLAGSVMLGVSQRSGAPALEPRSTNVGADGSFAFSSVPPGDYVVQAISGQPNGLLTFGMQYVTVIDGNPAPVTITTHTPASVHGRLTLDGFGARPDQFLVVPFPSDFDRSPMVGAGFPLSKYPDGTFRLEAVTGARRITLLRAPEGWYLKSATLDGRDITDDAVEFGLDGATYDDLDVVVSAHGASVSGTVDDVRDATNYSVLVFSTDRGRWFRNSRHMKLARPDRDGQFSVIGLPPGEYSVIAVDGLDAAAASGEWQDPSLLDALASNANRMTLGEGEHRGVRLRLVHR